MKNIKELIAKISMVVLKPSHSVRDEEASGVMTIARPNIMVTSPET